MGWSVFPVKGPHYSKDYQDSKTPICDWDIYQKQKPTTEVIKDWLSKSPKMSVGVVTGKLNGFFAIDIDGNDWAAHFPNADFGITWKSVSKRGCHYFYKWEDWMDDFPTTKSSVGGVKGFDIRGEGGYVVAPNGNESLRSWTIPPLSEPLAEMPSWIRAFLREKLNRRSEKKTAIPFDEITDGNRHTAFLSLIGKLHYAGMKTPDMLQILMPAAAKVNYESELVDLVEDVVHRYSRETKEGIKPESMEVLLSESEPPLEWLIEGLWTDKAKGFIAGHPGTGKTWIALDMMLSIATGGLCMGKYKPAYKAPCLIVEEEASRRNLQRRIHAMARARQLKPSDLSSVFHITQQFTNIPRDTKQIIEVIKQHGIKFVVFDSLREVHSSKENSSDEMAVVLKAFKEISVIGECAVLLIHHLSKSGMDSGNKTIFERMRGTGSLWAWRDCILGIEGEEESTVATCNFQFRDAESPKPVQVTRIVHPATGAIALEAVDMSESPEFMAKCEAAIEFVRAQLGGAYKTDIATALEGRKKDNLSAVKLMLKRGVLIAEKGGKIHVKS